MGSAAFVANQLVNLLRMMFLTCAVLLCANLAFAAAPTAVDDEFDVTAGQSVSGFLSVNDLGLDGPVDTYSLLLNAVNGSAVVNSDGSFTYTPNVGFSGPDTFDYQIDDGAGGMSSATVTVNVASTVDFLQVANPILFTPEDTSIPLGLSVSPDLFNGGALQDIPFQRMQPALPLRVTPHSQLIPMVMI